MLKSITILVAFQLAGELISFALLPAIHGPAIGLILLLLYFYLGRNGVSKDLQGTSDFFTSNLGILFVPAGVGVVAFFGLFASAGVPILLTLVISSLITLTVTALILDRLAMLFMPGEVSGQAEEKKHE